MSNKKKPPAKKAKAKAKAPAQAADAEPDANQEARPEETPPSPTDAALQAAALANALNRLATTQTHTTRPAVQARAAKLPSLFSHGGNAGRTLRALDAQYDANHRTLPVARPLPTTLAAPPNMVTPLAKARWIDELYRLAYDHNLPAHGVTALLNNELQTPARQLGWTDALTLETWRIATGPALADSVYKAAKQAIRNCTVEPGEDLADTLLRMQRPVTLVTELAKPTTKKAQPGWRLMRKQLEAATAQWRCYHNNFHAYQVLTQAIKDKKVRCPTPSSAWRRSRSKPRR
jgi:hypothetical protein